MTIRTLFTAALLTLTASAQRKLDKLPDPDPASQMAAFNLPEGMEINLFASDPTISKPVQMNWDTAGRLWLVSSGMYPHIVPGAEENDRILILEDTTGDGKADKTTVFAEDLHIPTAVMPAHGGAYVANSTEILFLKDTTGDGKADQRRVVLSGFGTEDTHHLVHTFKIGPDGLLYFMQSIYIHSHLETPYGVRRLMGGGIWHFNPITHRAEILSKGLVNPWGFIFDDYGQTFATDGAGGQGINYIFPRAVGVTSPGAQRTVPGLNPGEPKLCGLEVLTGQTFPEALQNNLLAPDFRGNRINSYRLKPLGSSYKSTRVSDFLSSSHRAFRPVDVKLGPDGALYIADWYNPIIQHGEVDFRDSRRDHTHGRIWRVTYKDKPLLQKQDYTTLTPENLLATIISENRQARLLARRELQNRDPETALKALNKWAPTLSTDFHRMQAMWTYQALNQTPSDLITTLAKSTDYRIRAAALRVAYHRHYDLQNAAAIAAHAIKDKNPQVRLWAVSLLAQIPSPSSVPTALQALDQPVDRTLDFALWSIVREHQDQWAPLISKGQKPFGNDIKHLLFAMKSLGKPLPLKQVFAALNSNEISPKTRREAFALISLIGTPDDLSKLMPKLKKNPAILEQLANAAKTRKIKPIKNLELLLPLLESNNRKTYQQAARLAGLWKLTPARQKLFQAFTGIPAKRSAAAEGLRLFGDPETIDLFVSLSNKNDDPDTQVLAVKELAQIAPQKAASAALSILAKDTEGKDPHNLFSIFLKNPEASSALAKAIEEQKIILPKKIASLGVQRGETSGKPPKDLIAALQNAGDLKPMTQKLSEEEMSKLVARVLGEGNPYRGEKIYRRIGCATCHAIGGVGSTFGPDMGSIGASAPVDYLVTSLLEPSDKIKEGYHSTTVTEKNGNIHGGMLFSESATEVVIRDFANKKISIPRVDIKTIEIAPGSQMPAGLTASLREDEFVDLVRFLSELGKEGDFKTTPTPYIRNWQALLPHDRTRDLIGHYGPAIFAEPFKGYQWQAYLSHVDGTLHPTELPPVAGRGNHWAVARFTLDETLQGDVTLKINDAAKLLLFDGEKQIKLPAKGPASVKVPAGGTPNRFTVAVNSKSPLSIEVSP